MRLRASEIGCHNRAAVSLLELSVVQPPPLQVSWGAESPRCKKCPRKVHVGFSWRGLCLWSNLCYLLRVERRQETGSERCKSLRFMVSALEEQFTHRLIFMSIVHKTFVELHSKTEFMVVAWIIHYIIYLSIYLYIYLSIYSLTLISNDCHAGSMCYVWQK